MALQLPAGRAAIVVRDVPTGARLIEIAGGARRRVAIAPLARSRARLLVFPSMAQSGTVELRILHGSLGVDGVGLASG